jgi:hypothetical protein
MIAEGDSALDGGECVVVSSADSECVVFRMEASVQRRRVSGRNDAVCK